MRVEMWTTTAQWFGQRNPGRPALRPPAAGVRAGRSANLHGFEPGDTIENGLPVRRFLASPRDEKLYRRLENQARSGRPLSLEEEAAFFRNGVWSEGMRRAIHNQRRECLYVFVPAFAATTVFGILAAPQESVLMPCLGAGVEASFRLMWEAADACHHWLFSCEQEREALAELFGLGAKRCLCAEGVDYADEKPSRAASRGASPPAAARKPYALFLGRQGGDGAAEELIGWFRGLIGDSPLPLRLVLAGEGEARIPPECAETVVGLGRVDERTKWALLANALCVLAPCGERRLPVSLLEGWLARRPALVHPRSRAAAALTEHAGAGLVYRSCDEFRHALEWLAREPAQASALGDRGEAHVRARFRWSDAIDELALFFREIEQWLAEAELIG
ncbi:MAG: glycosyltransferase [Candidatus Sumerlaeota bacterium]|nr:glycosyltransferase [Candidatus Sumerlaeota bacterium]